MMQLHCLSLPQPIPLLTDSTYLVRLHNRHGDKLRPVGDKLRPVGDKLRPVGDKLRPVGDKLRPVGDKLRPVVNIEVDSL